MKAVRRFFGNLCGGSGVRKDNNDDQPVDRPKEDIEQASEPTILADEVKVEETAPTDELIQSGDGSLTGSPCIKQDEQKEVSTVSIQKIYDVEAMKPEVLDMNTADKIFKDAVEILDSFIKECKTFKAALLDFERRYSRDKRPDFRKCLLVHFRNEIKQKSNSLEEPNLNTIGDDATQESPSHSLLCIENTGKQLLETIKSTVPSLDECIEEAEKNDMKEYVKGKIEEQGQQGLLSKFSAPGKYRRNMKQLTKQRKLLDEIDSEVKFILANIEQGKDGLNNVNLSHQDLEQHVEAEQDSHPADEASIVEAADAVSPLIVTADVLESIPADISAGHDAIVKEAENDDVDKQDGETEEATKDSEKPDQEEHSTVAIDVDTVQPITNNSVHNQSHVSEHEKADVILPLRSSSPVLTKGKLSDSCDRLENGKLVDYGSYLVLDPSANDDAPIMRRSRSLDSLSSLGSRRSMSRYGSYEFVTDYEIKIADKCETEKAQKMLTTAAELKKTSVEATVSQPKKIMPKHRGTVPLYKYTEVEYNPLGL